MSDVTKILTIVDIIALKSNKEANGRNTECLKSNFHNSILFFVTMKFQSSLYENRWNKLFGILARNIGKTFIIVK